VISNTPAPRADGCEQFFGFRAPPFSLSANPRFRFPSAAHEEALSQVLYALQRREPVIVVTGDIGLGKTLLCRTVLERLPRKTFLSVIDDPLLGPDDLLKRILENFGVISAEHAGSIDVSRHELAHAMNRFLASLAPLTAHAVVIIDEAQHVRSDVLEQIRLLANSGDDRGTLLQIVLVGQPTLQTLLAKPELQQLRQRITRFVTLSGLTDDEVKQYIVHRLTVAREAETDSPIPGAHDLARALAAWNESSRPATFTDEAIEAAARMSHGVPRLVNVLCDRALEVAFEQRSRSVDAQTVAAAARLVQLDDAIAETPPVVEEGHAASRSGRVIAAVAAVILVGATAWFGVRARNRVPLVERPAIQSSTPPPQTKSVAIPAPVPPPAAASGDSGTVSPVAVAAPNPSAADGAVQADQSFEIVVASFRTDSKAAEVVEQLTNLGEPVHQRAIDGWQQVVAGPFTSRAAAEVTQGQLDREGFIGTRIVRAAR
jgi:general secretion pathway protein A